jgi:hypothetical protein
MRPVLRAIEDGAPRLELAHAVGRLLGVQLGHAPVVEVLAAAHRVGEVHLPAVAVVDVAIAAAMPPSAMTVCALPSSDLQTRPTDTPAADASMAARRPGAARADDEDVVLVGLDLGPSDDPPVVQHARREQADVDVGPADPHEAEPRPLGVVRLRQLAQS